MNISPPERSGEKARRLAERDVFHWAYRKPAEEKIGSPAVIDKDDPPHQKSSTSSLATGPPSIETSAT